MVESPARRALLEAAVALIAQQGATSVGLTAIRQRAGVSVGATYHHFVDRQALLDGAWLDCLADYQAGFLDRLRHHAVDWADGLADLLAWHLHWHVDQRSRALVLRESGLPSAHPVATARLKELNRPFFREINAWWDAGVIAGTLADVERDLAHALWFGPAQALCGAWLRAGGEPPSRHVATLTRTAQAALLTGNRDAPPATAG